MKNSTITIELTEDAMSSDTSLDTHVLQQAMRDALGEYLSRRNQPDYDNITADKASSYVEERYGDSPAYGTPVRRAEKVQVVLRRCELVAAVLRGVQQASIECGGAPQTCEDNGGDDSNPCHECLACLERLKVKLRHAERYAHKNDEADRACERLSQQVAELKHTLEVE